MKKILSLLLACCLMMGIVSCTGKQEEAPNTSQDESAGSVEGGGSTSNGDNSASEESGINLEALLDILADSGWSGVDIAENCYALQIQDGSFQLVIRSPDGTTTWEGTCSLEDSVLKFFEGVDLSKPLSDFTYEFSINGDNSYVKINDTYLTRDTLTGLDARLLSLDLAAMACKYLGHGNCWIACFEDRAVVLNLDRDQILLQLVELDGEERIVSKVEGTWSLNGEGLLVALGDRVLRDYSWSFNEEEELKQFTLSDGTEEMVFYETTVESVEEGLDIAYQYLINHKGIDDIEDLTTVLTGYYGYSIVDAFVMAGLDPSFDNRAIFAQAFNIENYRGTAEQNIFLLQSMGGVVRG